MVTSPGSLPIRVDLSSTPTDLQMPRTWCCTEPVVTRLVEIPPVDDRGLPITSRPAPRTDVSLNSGCKPGPMSIPWPVVHATPNAQRVGGPTIRGRSPSGPQAAHVGFHGHRNVLIHNPRVEKWFHRRLIRRQNIGVKSLPVGVVEPGTVVIMVGDLCEQSDERIGVEPTAPEGNFGPQDEWRLGEQTELCPVVDRPDRPAQGSSYMADGEKTDRPTTDRSRNRMSKTPR